MAVCSLIHTLTAFWLGENNNRAAAGIPITEISRNSQVSREWVYQQKNCVLDYIQSLNNEREYFSSIVMDKLYRTHGAQSLPGLQCVHRRHPADFSSVFGLQISSGKIDSIIREASERAELFDSGIPLDGIK